MEHLERGFGTGGGRGARGLHPAVALVEPRDHSDGGEKSAPRCRFLKNSARYPVALKMDTIGYPITVFFLHQDAVWL